jgi:hypothetical protein
MLNNIQQRKEFFERRPEDHPKYAEEWKLFWERRYKELQMLGRDPTNHDFQVFLGLFLHLLYHLLITFSLGMYRILVLPDIRLAGYPANPKAGYRISDKGRIPDIRPYRLLGLTSIFLVKYQINLCKQL